MKDGEIRALQEIIDRSRRIVFFGGAGVSTASGIPDFRSAQGLCAENEDGLTPEMILSRTFFMLQPERFFDYYRKHLLYPEAKPNAAHRKLFELEQADRLRGIVTQNVDGLHKDAGNIRVYEIHGNVHENYCMDCNASYPMETILRAEGIPRCKDCGGVIRPNVTLYGEALEKYVCIGALREITNADTLIVAGTSLAVEPAASFISHFRGKNLVVLNRDPIPAEEKATLVIHGDVAEIMNQLIV
jgi:NAD-dependent deacetylase